MQSSSPAAKRHTTCFAHARGRFPDHWGARRHGGTPRASRTRAVVSAPHLSAPFRETGDEDKSFLYTCRSALPRGRRGITWSVDVVALKAEELEGVYGTTRDCSTNCGK